MGRALGLRTGQYAKGRVSESFVCGVNNETGKSAEQKEDPLMSKMYIARCCKGDWKCLPCILVFDIGQVV